MIQIDDVGDGSYAFPTIDFKFHNPGGTSAVLWQFAIEVIEAKLDLTPVPAFTFDVDSMSSIRSTLDTDDYSAGGELVISMVNHGDGEQIVRRALELEAKAELNTNERRELSRLGWSAKELGKQPNHPFLDPARPLPRNRPGRRKPR
jgi:hypothetical protein